MSLDIGGTGPVTALGPDFLQLASGSVPAGSGSVARLYAATSSANSAVDTFYFRNSADSEYELEKFALTNESNTWTADQVFGGTTPQITIGDAGAEDTMLVFDGNAQDYRIGLDDGTDKLEIGVGAAHGTTTALTVDSSQQVTVVATTAASTATDGALYVAGGASVAGDIVVGDDLSLLSDSAVLNFGAGNDVTFTHDGGTGMDIVSAGSLDVSSTAGSVTMTVADGQTVTVGKSGASALLLSPHGTAGSELASLINTAGTTDGTDAAGAILLSSAAGGMGLAWADTKDLWAEGGSMMFVANEDKASCIQLHADAGTSQTIHVVNDAGTSVTEGAAAVQLLASAGGIGIKSTADLASAILITADGGTSETIKVHSDQGTGATSIELVSDAGGVSILAGNTTHGVKIATGTSGVPVTIGHSTSEVTVADNLTVSGNLTVTGTTITDTVEVISTSSGVLFEGGTDDGHEGTLISAVAGADVTYTLPNLTGHVPLLADAASNANVTAAEFALLDGGSSVGTTAVVDGDGILTNDGGTMKQTTVQTFQTYFDANSVGGGNMVTVGALNAGSITSGFGAIDNGTSGIRTATFTAETAYVPDANDGATLGTAALSFSDMYLADGGQVLFGNDSEITLTHVADTGLTLTHTGTGDNLPIVLQLKSEEDAVIADEVIASIEFAAGDSDGTDGATVAAGIHAIAEEAFGADANATKLVFTAADSETAAASATAKMTLSSAGNLTTAGTITAVTSIGIGNAVLTEAELEMLDTITAGTAAASKAVVLDGSKNIATIGTVGCGAITSTGNSAMAQLTTTGRVIVDDTTAATTTTDGSLQTDGGLSVALDAVVGDDLMMLSDGAVVHFGADKEITLTHVADTGLTLAGSHGNGTSIQLNNSAADGDCAVGFALSGTNVWSMGVNDGDGDKFVIEDGAGALGADPAFEIASDKSAKFYGTLEATTSFTIGSAALTEAELELLDGITAGTAAASKAVVLDASKNISTIGTVGCGAITSTGNSSFAQGTFSGRVIVDDSTAATSTTDGSLQTDGGLSVALDAVIGDDLFLLSDSAVLKFGADSDTTLTHTDGTGLTLNSTNKLCFNDATQFVQGISGTVLGLGATDEIDLTTATVDINATTEVNIATPSLVVTSATDEKPLMTLETTHAAANPSEFRFYKNSASPASADGLGALTWYGKDSAGNVEQFSKLVGVVGNPTNGSESGVVVLQCAVGGVKRDIVGFHASASFGMELQNNSTYGTVKAHSFITYSDETLKHDIKTLKDPIEKVKNLRGVSYTWNSDKTDDIGFIAQEVNKVVPELIYGKTAGPGGLGIDYGSMTALLVEAVKKQQDQIENLKKVVEALKK